MKKIKIGILVVFSFFFFICLYNLYSIYKEENNENRIKKELIDLVDISNISEEDKLDFDKLKKINPDIVGWIKIDGTNINYPILKAKDNDYYLNHSFYRKSNQLGSIFMDAKTNSDFSSFNTFIYGHYTTNGSMFGELKKYMNKDFYDRHRDIHIYTPKKNYIAKVFSVYIDSFSSSSYQPTISTLENYKNYIEIINNKRKFNSDININYMDDKIITLFSCTKGTDSAERYYIHAKLI